MDTEDISNEVVKDCVARDTARAIADYWYAVFTVNKKESSQETAKKSFFENDGVVKMIFSNEVP